MINTHFHLMVIDETSHWREDIAKAAGKIKTVYLYDALKGINLAELQTSHELTPLYYITENNVNDQVNEDISFSFNNENYIYIHCNQVVSQYDFGEQAYDDDYQKIINEIVENEQCDRRNLTIKKSIKP